MPPPRLLIFVIAYYAESTLRRVLERIPPEVLRTFDCEVLVVDDASADRTFQIGQEFQASHPELRMTVLRNEFNQGYGGNQKVGYAYALEAGFDLVALVHGDGQYAPEKLPEMLAPVAKGEADAVLGSRMTTRWGALKAGMPLYKFLGNRVLTLTQNFLSGTQLSEFHSGYRVYSTAALRKIHFDLNSNDFTFDTEILLQLMNTGARLVEVPIPTYSGGEISSINGLKYARDVVKATLQNRAHRSWILYQRRFDSTVEDNVHYDLKLGYASSHTYALEAVPDGATVVDIGAGPGLLAQELVAKGCKTTVVDQFAPPHPSAEIEFQQQNLDEAFKVDVKPHEVILLLDILEHLRLPEKLLGDLREQFDHTPKKVIITAPNIAFVVQRIGLLLGQFNHGKAGTLDHTHIRHFTFRSLIRLARDNGLRVRKVRGVPAPFPKVLGTGALGRGAVAVNLALIRLSKTLFSYQIYIEAETTPHVRFVLQDTKARSLPPSPRKPG